MGLTGDFVKLHELRARLDSAVKVLHETARDVAPQLKDEVAAEFPAGQDPYRGAWAALRPATLATGRTPPPLTDTRAMQNSLNVKPEGGSILFRMGGPAVYHQFGTRNMAARRIFPTDGMPVVWSDIIKNAVRKQMVAHLAQGKAA